MRAETCEWNNRTIHLRYCDDWLDFLSFAERVERGRKGQRFNGMGCASLEETNYKNSWSGTDSLAEAIQLARKGWPEGIVQVEELIHRIRVNKLFPYAERLVRTVDVAGDEPDVDLFLTGEPEHMVTLSERTLFNRGKVVRLILNRSAASGIDQASIVRRGVGVMLAFEVMRLLGFSPELTICQAVSGDYDRERFELYVPVLHAGDPTNLDTLAFMFQHPSVLRRLFFALEDCEPTEIRHTFGFMNHGGYGVPVEPLLPPEHDLLLSWRDGLVSSDEEIEDYALKILRDVGIDLEEMSEAA